jgi:hypothetical protein
MTGHPTPTNTTVDLQLPWNSFKLPFQSYSQEKRIEKSAKQNGCRLWCELGERMQEGRGRMNKEVEEPCL